MRRSVLFQSAVNSYMKAILLSLLFSCVAAANYGNQVSVLLDVGATSLTITNTGSVGGTLGLTFSPPATRRVRFTISPIYVPPPSGTTYSTCADPCGVSTNRQWGQQYYWVEYVDSSGNSLSPRLISQAGAAYTTGSCGSIGTLPMVEPAVVTTAPFPMPIEVIGQDCYVTRGQLPLAGGHASTGIRWWIRVHSPGYKLKEKIDGKLDLKINSGAWLHFTNANTGLNAVDEMKYYACIDIPSAPGIYPNGIDCSTHRPIGGYAQTRDYTMDIADGTIGSGDTTVTQAWRFNGTDSDVSGSRVIESFPIEGTDHTILQIVCTSSGASCTVKSTANGFSAGDDVVIRGMPGERMRFNGPRHIISITDADNFVIAACLPAGTFSTGGSKASSCLAPIDSKVYKPPVSRQASLQAYAYATRMLTPISAFVYTDPTTFTAPGSGDATRGNCLIEFGNTACTPNLTDQLVSPVTPSLNYTFHFAKCGSCHSPHLEDLKYHNYSNNSIAQRTYFHGGSTQDGLDIAAAVRGNSIQAPLAARPWSPPLQTGPGMSRGTFRRADTTSGFTATMTSIVTTTTLGVTIAKMNVPSDPRDFIRVGDPLTVFGATVDTDLNGTYPVTAVSSTQIWFTVTNVSDATYNESTLVATMANDFSAGCGVDCVGTYGYDEFMESAAPGGSKALWPWNKRIELRDIIYPHQFADWPQWLPFVHPADAVPSANYLTSTPYLYYQSCLASITPGDFTSYKAANYCGDLFSKDPTGGFLEYWGRDDAKAVENPPATTNKFRALAPLLGAYSPGSNYHLARQSVMNSSAVAMWTINIVKQTLGLNIQRMTDLMGAATAYGCYPPWGMGAKQGIFNVGSHKSEMFGNAILDGMYSTYEYASNAWYIAALAINGGDCYDQNDNPIDIGYLFAFLNQVGSYRPLGQYYMLTSALSVPQLGNQNQYFARYGADNQGGTDWSSLFIISPWQPQGGYQSYQWMTDADNTAAADDYLDLLNGMFAAHDHTYWESVFTHSSSPFNQQPCHNAGAIYNNGAPSVCDFLAYNITFMKMFGANATNLSTLVSFLKTINLPTWVTHDWDNDVSAASEGDAANGATGDLSVAGSGKVITFTSCPTNANGEGWGYNISSTGGELYETLVPTGGTCVGNSAGTLTFTTTRPHTGTITARSECSVADPKPNYVLNGGFYFRCRANMF